MSGQRPIVILGPTAGGKSELAVALAERLGGAGGSEILSADSMQVYRHMDAGTAKPEPALRKRVPHHGIDIVEPTEPFSVADWLVRAEKLIGRLRQRGAGQIVVGGTNLYIKALLEGMFDGPPADREFRAALVGQAPPQLHERLVQVDPEAAQRIHPNDRKRIVRALEVFELTGRPISAWQRQWDSRALGIRDSGRATRDLRLDPILIGLQWPVEAINRRINLRVKAMFYPDKVDPGLAGRLLPRGESLPEEVNRLEAAGLLGPQARAALGYKQLLAHLSGQGSLDDAFDQTRIQTRRFAKHQRTWLKRFVGVHWLDAFGGSVTDLADRAAQTIHATAKE